MMLAALVVWLVAEANVASGAEVFRLRGCDACHSLDGTKGSGPTLGGVFNSRVVLADRTVVVADEAYLRESILKPGARVVAGFLPIMPQYRLVLSAAEVDALVVWLMTLEGRR